MQQPNHSQVSQLKSLNNYREVNWRSKNLKSQIGHFYFTIGNIKSIDQNNLILVKHYFRANGHDFNRDTKFIIIERIEKDTNMKSMIENKVSWMVKNLKTYVPFGFNAQLNQPTWKKYKFD